jgi:hypothetical protein
MPTTPGATTPGAPPTFGATPPVGPEVSANTFAEAEKLMQVRLSPAQRQMAAGSWRVSLSSTMERRTGPRKLAIEDSVAPATVWHPAAAVGAQVGAAAGPARERFVRSRNGRRPLPARDEDIAFAPVTTLSRWIETRALTSERLTRIYLERIKRLDGKLRSVITLTGDHALARARLADKEIAAGKYRGPLHGIPYGVKDLLDTKDIRTTWGAEFYRDRVPAQDAAVVAKLDAAGAVLIAKLSLGALALNDIWFGGQTMNPWLLDEGASGSSAGPGAATAAGLVAFSIGSETGGSIVSPAMRCGVTGLRPTYGRVPRTGAMTLCWSLDKLGPMTRGVEDAMLVLKAISGVDAGDVAERAGQTRFRRDREGGGPEGRLFCRLDEGSAGHGRRPCCARQPDEAGLDPGAGDPAGLAVPVAEHGAVRGSGGGVRGDHAGPPRRPAQGPGAGRLAESVPRGALPVGGGLRAGRPHAPQGGAGDGADLPRGRPAAGAFAARRDADDLELHRPPVADPAHRLRDGGAGAQ